MKTKLLISTAMVATAFCVNAAQAENPPANMSNDRYVYPTVDGGTYTMINAVLESGNDAEEADPVDMLIKDASITATDSDIESTGKLKIDGSTISVISTKITNEQLEPWIRYGEEDEEVMEELYGIYARDDIDIVDSQISLTRSYINANSELKDGNLTISDTENDDKPTSLTLTNSRIDTGAIDVKGGEINIKDSAMHGMFDITVSGGVTNIDNGELTVDVGSPVDDVYTQGKLTISGGEINLKNGGSIGVEIPDEGVGSQGTVEMTGGKINVVNKGDVVTKEFDMTDGELNIAQGATFDVIKDAYLDESDKVVISEYSDIVMGDDAVINLAGNLNTSGISGTGTLNFNAENAVVDGDVENVNVTFNADNTLSKAITGEVSGKSLNITKGTIVLDNDKATFNSLNISGGTTNVDDDFYVSTLQNPNGGDIAISDGTVNLNGYSLNAMSGGITVSGGIINIKNVGEDPDNTLWAAKDINITGGVVNMEEGSSIDTFYDWLDEGDNQIDKPEQPGNISINGGTVNVTGQSAEISSEGRIEVSDGGVINIAEGASLESYSSYSIVDGDMEEGDKATISLKNDGTINLSGTLFANIDGNEAGTLNFNAANAKVNGTINGGVINFNKDNTLSNAITGAVTANTLNVNAGTFTIDRGIEVGNFNVIGGTTNIVSSELEASGIISITGGNTILNQGELKAHDGSLNISGGTLTLTNDSEVWAGTTTVSDSAVVNVTDSEFSGDKTLNIQGGTITLNNSYMMPDEGTAGNPSLFNMTGGTVNLNNSAIGSQLDSETEVFDAGSSILAGGVINALSGNNTFLMKDVEVKNTVNVANGATLNVFEKYDDDAESFNTKGTLNLVNNGTINLSGKLYADVDGTDAGALNFNAANAVVDGDVENVNVTFNADNTLSKAITGSLDYVTSLNIAKGTLIFDRAVSLDSLNVASVLDAGLNKVEIDGDANFAATSTLKIEIAEDDNGSFKANNINVDDGAKLAFNITKKMEIGEEIKNVALLDGNLNGVFKNQLSNSRYTITSEDDKVFNISYDASASDVVIDAGGSSGNAATAEAWDSMVNQESASDQAKAVASVLVDLSQNATTVAGQKAYVNALTALAPDTAPAVQQAATEGANQIFGAVGTRLSGGSIAPSRQGMSSGDNPFTNTAVWVQGLFNKAKLDDTKASKGFDSKTYGTAMGIEGKLNEEIKLGLGYAYSKTDIDGFMRDTDAKTHTAIVYGEYKPSDWYVNMVASYGWSKYNEKKKVGVMTVKSDWDVESLAVQVMTGYQFNIDGFGITPELGLRYIHIKQDGYKDTADQRVLGSNSDILTGVLGTKVAKSWALENGMLITPEIKAAMTYDMKNDKGGSVVTLANGSTYAVSGKAMNRFGVELGAGITMEVNDNVELSLGYEGKFRDNYQDHTGLINAKYKF